MQKWKQLKYETQPLIIKKLIPWALSTLLPITLVVTLYFYALPLLLSPSNLLLDKTIPDLHTGMVNVSSGEMACDYPNGEWILDRVEPLYNGTTCGGTIREGQNCMRHGRPDMDYLYWRWKPKGCTLPRFEPEKFLQLLKNKNFAFVGDSVARNQLESLVCMMATVSAPNLVYSNGEDNKFRKWHFPSHNINVSIFWSPFLVRGIEKTDEVDPNRNFNRLYLDNVDDKWAAELSDLDMIVLSAGHWYLLRAVFYYGDSDSVLGCHAYPGQNCTEIGFYDVYGKALKTTLDAIIDRKNAAIDVLVNTFSAEHFEGPWDKFGACPETQPYKPHEKKLDGVGAEMRKVGIQEIEAAKMKANKLGKLIRFQAVDVSRLSQLRPDGHPGPYMHPFPFANGISDRVQNDCVHWCLPGPIDTWNQILFDIINKWERKLI